VSIATDASMSGGVSDDRGKTQIWRLREAMVWRSKEAMDFDPKPMLLAQNPITLVFMMTNSCSYSTKDLVAFKFQILIKILVDV